MDRPGDGKGFTTHTETSSEAQAEFCSGGKHPRPCTDPPSTTCKNAGTAFANSIRNGLPAGVSSAALAEFSVSVSWEILEVDIDPEPPAGGGPHATTTQYRCDLVVDHVPEQMSGPRGGCGCAEFQPNVCNRGGKIAVLSDPGIVRPATPGSPSQGSLARTFVEPPSCTTCDTASIDDPASAQALFTCLDQSLHNMDGVAGHAGIPSGGTSNEIASLASRMELLLELAGDKLTSSQQSRGVGVYTERPTGLPACGSPVTLAPDCVAQGAQDALAGTVQMCSDIAVNPMSTRAVAQLELPACLTALSNVDKLTSDACRLSTRDFADTGARGVLSRAQPDYSTDLAISLPIAMTQLNSWWGAAHTAARGDTSWLLDHVSALTRNFWSALEQAKVPLPENTTDDATTAQLLANVADVELVDDIAVISAMFDATQATASPMLLTLTGDALHGIEDRINRLETIHDVGCRFANCKTNPAKADSPLAELVHALAVLPDASQLTSVLASAGKLQTQQPALHAALSKLAAQHVRLETVWAALDTSDPFSALATVANPPSEAAGLVKLVSEASLAWQSYAATGEFMPGHRPRLTVATLEQGSLVSELDSQIATLASARASYTTGRRDAVNLILQQIQNNATRQSVVDHDNELIAQLNDTVTRSLGLEAREAAARAQLAQFQQAFELVAPALDKEAVFQAINLTSLHPSAADAHHPLNNATSLVTDRFDVETLNSGESLRLHVTGTWSPTCAISKAVLAVPGSSSSSILVPNPALTSSTGYIATLDNNNYKAHTESSSNDTRVDLGLSIEQCTAGQVAGNGFKVCAHLNLDSISDNSTSDSTASQARMDASFVTGIRLQSTPYPVAPAGSLVAVMTRAGDPSNVINVHVVQADDVLLAPTLPAGAGSQIDIHLVVNDGVGGGCVQDTTNQLRIDMVKTTSVGSIAKAMAPAMAATLSEIEAQAPQILAEGQLSADESTALRSQAWTRLQSALPPGTSLSGLPSDLHQLFQSYLDAEIASISRRGEMHAVALQRRQLELELANNFDELAFADKQSRLLFLLPRWQLRDLSGVDMGQATDAVSLDLTAYAAPVFELRDPSHYTSLSTAVAGQAAALINVNITAPLEDQVGNLQMFATSVRNAVSLASFELPATARRTIVIAIPRPPSSTNPHPIPPEWQTVSTAAATAFWASAQDAQGNPQASAVLTLSPQDLYVFGGSAAALTCSALQSDVAPMIRRMALYLDTLSPPANQLGIDLAARAGGRSDVAFPLVGSVEQFEPDDPRGIPLPLPVLAGGSGEVLDKFAAGGSDLGAGAGLSPFTSFEIDLSGLAAPNALDAWNNTQGLYLVFDVERAVSNDAPDVEGVCVKR